MKVGASKGFIRVDLKKIMAGGGFPGNQKTPLDTHGRGGGSGQPENPPGYATGLGLGFWVRVLG